MPQKPSIPIIPTKTIISTTKQVLSSVNTKINSITNFLDKTTETPSIDETTNADDFENILKEFIFSELGIAFMAIIACDRKKRWGYGYGYGYGWGGYGCCWGGYGGYGYGWGWRRRWWWGK
uniref:Uncharacterized protein n=1 Tax=Meloidogyne hapla TaxID=6305 RepID=A0A1I8BSX4_MELHA